MTFSYNNNVPNAPDSPSVDQPDMKTNTQSINSIIAVDHVGFNTSGGGRHLQVTFNSNNTPVIPTSPPVLFTANDAFSTPQLFWYSGNASKTSNQYARNASSASSFLLGGLIIKCGKFTAAGSGATTVALTYAGAPIVTGKHFLHID